MTYKQGAYNVLGILQGLAPNGKAQEKCATAYRDAEKDSRGDDKLFLQTMTGLLYDGLAYGNWPWNR